jgi:hypothetical protein
MPARAVLDPSRSADMRPTPPNTTGSDTAGGVEGSVAAST